MTPNCKNTVLIFLAETCVDHVLLLFRFFCPPPCIYLFGNGWKLKKAEIQRLYDEFKQSERAASAQCSSSTNQTPLEKIENSVASELCTYIGIGNSDQDKQALDFSGSKVVFPFRLLHS